MTRSFLFLAGVVFGALSFVGGYGIGLVHSGPGQSEDALKAMIRAELVRQTEELSARRTTENGPNLQLAADLAALRAQISQGYVVHKSVEVTEARVAYPLIEPKLMLSVEGLPGGALIVNFANDTRSLRVAQTIEFEHGTCQCYLLLSESARDRAVFEFGCEERGAEDGL